MRVKPRAHASERDVRLRLKGPNGHRCEERHLRAGGAAERQGGDRGLLGRVVRPVPRRRAGARPHRRGARRRAEARQGEHRRGARAGERYGIASIPTMLLFRDGEPPPRRSARSRRAPSSARWVFPTDGARANPRAASPPRGPAASEAALAGREPSVSGGRYGRPGRPRSSSQHAVRVPAARGTQTHDGQDGAERRRVFVRVEVAEEGCVLAEQYSRARSAHGGPVLDPGLGEIVLDVVQSAVAHAQMIGIAGPGTCGRTAHSGPTRDSFVVTSLLLLNPRSGEPHRGRSCPRRRRAG